MQSPFTWTLQTTNCNNMFTGSLMSFSCGSLNGMCWGIRVVGDQIFERGGDGVAGGVLMLLMSPYRYLTIPSCQASASQIPSGPAIGDHHERACVCHATVLLVLRLMTLTAACSWPRQCIENGCCVCVVASDLTEAISIALRC